MDQLKTLSDFLIAVANDPRISITHIGIYVALFEYWKEHNFQNPFHAFSHEIMRIAKISSSGTYHKIIHDLHSYCYIRYEPSYKHNRGSKVHLKISVSCN